MTKFIAKDTVQLSVESQSIILRFGLNVENNRLLWAYDDLLVHLYCDPEIRLTRPTTDMSLDDFQITTSKGRTGDVSAGIGVITFTSGVGKNTDISQPAVQWSSHQTKDGKFYYRLQIPVHLLQPSGNSISVMPLQWNDVSDIHNLASLRAEIGYEQDGFQIAYYKEWKRAEVTVPEQAELPENVKNIFISYARKDGRTLALKLQKDLQKRDFTVWLDTSEIEGGVSWSKAIEDAIEECDIAIALLSHGSFVSDICRGEQLRCLRKKKRVIPLLVQEKAERPLYLEHINYRDFTTDATYNESFDQLLNDVFRGKFVDAPEDILTTNITNVPALPPHFVERPDDTERLRREIVSDKDVRRIALTALQGMGGIGKSALASAICRDEIVHATYPDGIIWVEVGRENISILSQIHLISRELGEPLAHINNEQEAISSLRKLLANKSVLIVLDDVWEIENAMVFSEIDAPRSRIFITTRDASIASKLGAVNVQLGVMETEAALELIVKWAGRELPEMPEIARKLGYLPLALKIAGGLLEEIDGSEWLATFKELSELKADILDETPEGNLRVCFDLSVQRLQNYSSLYHLLGIFPEDTWLPEHVVFKLWQNAQSSLKISDCKMLVRKIYQLALVERRHSDGAIHLHDLLHDFNRTQLKNEQKYQSAHLNFLDAYNTEFSKNWSEIESDGYIYNNLVYHLIVANQLNEVKRLFDDDRWLWTRLATDEYIYDFYLEDLHKVWSYTSKLAIENRSKARYLECVRYALIVRRINMQASTFIPELVVRAVETGLDNWNVKRALSIASRVPRTIDRAEMYLNILKMSVIDTETSDQTANNILEALEEFMREREPSPVVRMGVPPLIYVELAPYVSRKTDLFERLLDVLFQEDTHKRVAQVVHQIGHYIPDELLDRVIKTVLPMDFDYDWMESPVAYAISSVVERLNEFQIKTIQEYYTAGRDYEELQAVFSQDYINESTLDRSMRYQLTNDTQKIALESVDIDEYVSQFALNRFMDIDDTNLKDFSEILPKLSEAQTAEILDKIISFDDMFHPSEIRSEYISIIAPYLTVALQKKLIASAKNTVMELPSILRSIVNSIDSTTVEYLIHTILTDLYDHQKIECIKILAPVISGDSLENVIQYFGRSDKSYSYIDTLINLFEHIDIDLQEQYFDHILTSISGLKRPYVSQSDELLHKFSKHKFQNDGFAVRLLMYIIDENVSFPHFVPALAYLSHTLHFSDLNFFTEIILEHYKLVSKSDSSQWNEEDYFLYVYNSSLVLKQLKQNQPLTLSDSKLYEQIYENILKVLEYLSKATNLQAYFGALYILIPCFDQSMITKLIDHLNEKHIPYSATDDISFFNLENLNHSLSFASVSKLFDLLSLSLLGGGFNKELFIGLLSQINLYSSLVDKALHYTHALPDTYRIVTVANLTKVSTELDASLKQVLLQAELSRIYHDLQSVKNFPEERNYADLLEEVGSSLRDMDNSVFEYYISCIDKLRQPFNRVRCLLTILDEFSHDLSQRIWDDIVESLHHNENDSYANIAYIITHPSIINYLKSDEFNISQIFKLIIELEESWTWS